MQKEIVQHYSLRPLENIKATVQSLENYGTTSDSLASPLQLIWFPHNELND